MGSFNSKYENYYNELINKRYNGSSNNYYMQNDNKGILNKDKLVKKITLQLTGSLVLFLFAFGCRYVVTPETKQAYNFAKSTVNYNYDYNSVAKYVQNVNSSEIINKFNSINSDYLNDKATAFIDEIKFKISGQKTVDDEIKSTFISPISGEITSHFGNKISTANSKSEFNNGVDININGNVEVKCSNDGTIADMGTNKSGVKFIQIDHGEGIVTEYYGFSSISVNKGDEVKKNQVIGRAGSNDSNTKTNFHFEISYMGENRDPEKYFSFK
ncbi:MAG: M23 family metallopeptidase [Bacillota bacterium]|nr:M23 family metallopeptidase [Bacillota bacterium]